MLTVPEEIHELILRLARLTDEQEPLQDLQDSSNAVVGTVPQSASIEGLPLPTAEDGVDGQIEAQIPPTEASMQGGNWQTSAKCAFW